MHYHIVDADPEGEQTVGGIPGGTVGFRGKELLELPNLVDNGSGAPPQRAQGSGSTRRWRKAAWGVGDKVYISSHPRGTRKVADVQDCREIRCNERRIDGRATVSEVKDLNIMSAVGSRNGDAVRLACSAPSCL